MTIVQKVLSKFKGLTFSLDCFIIGQSDISDDERVILYSFNEQLNLLRKAPNAPSVDWKRVDELKKQTNQYLSIYSGNCKNLFNNYAERLEFETKPILGYLDKHRV